MDSMFGGRSIQLARVLGIRVGVDASWLIFLFVWILWFSSDYRDQYPGQDSKAFGLAVVSVFLLFLSILLHELGHAVVARRNGIDIVGIDLWMFGGFAQMRRDSPSPGVDFRIAAAGPLVTFVIAVACFAAGSASVGTQDFVDVMRFSGPSVGAATAVLAQICAINIALLVFNLLPGFPLDGGRILRAAAWWRTGDRNRATRIAASAGRALAWGIGGLGVFLMLTSGGFGGGLWLVVVALIIGQGARAGLFQSEVSSRLEGLRVADVMDAQPVAVPATTTLERALDDWFLRYGWDWFPVVDPRGHFEGLVRREDVEGVPEQLRHHRTIAGVMPPDTLRAFRVRVDEPLEALLGSEGLQRLGAIMAVDGDGVLRGVVTVEQVSRVLRPRAGVA